AAHRVGGQAGGQLLEGLAAVGGLVDAGVLAEADDGVVGVVAVGDLPAQGRVEAVAAPLPQGHEQGVGVPGVHLHVDDAGVLVGVEDLGRGRAAVGGLEQAALGVGAVEPAEGADVDDVGVGGVNGDAADLESLFEAHVLPGLAAVGGLVDAVAVGDAVARVVLAGADPDDVGVGRGDGDVADGAGGFPVDVVLEGDAVVGGLEQAAAAGGDVVDGGVGLVDGEGGDAAAHVGRADAAPLHRLDPVGGQLGAAGGRLFGLGGPFLRLGGGDGFGLLAAEVGQ